MAATLGNGNITFGDSTTQSTAALPLTGGTLTGALSGTSISTTGNVTIGGALAVNGNASFTTGRIYLRDQLGGQSFELGTASGSGDHNYLGMFAPAGRGLAFFGGGNEHMRIDPSGRVKFWNQPGFAASCSGGTYTFTADFDVFVAGIVKYNNGGWYNATNGRFSIPVTGRYLVWCSMFAQGGISRIPLVVNNNFFTDPYLAGMGTESNGSSAAGSAVFYLTAGDWIQIGNQYAGASYYLAHCGWGAHLLA